jgi:hypothetical protein
MTVCSQNRHFIIYKITNQVNGKVYIGQTAKTLERRKQGHIRDAMLGSGCAIHRAIRKYGIEKFRFETLFYCLSKEEMNQREIETIKAMCANGSGGYNLTDGGKGANGHIVSDETREKMRIVMTGRKFSEERRAKAGKAHIGLKRSDETKAKMSKAHKGHHRNLGWKPSEETRAKLSLAKKGRPPNSVGSPKTAKWYAAMHATKGRISNRLGCKVSEETKEKQRVANTGRKHTVEAKAKIKEAWIIRKQKMASRMAA